jgi:hypothetical protein
VEILQRSGPLFTASCAELKSLSAELIVKVKVKVTLRLMVSQPVSLGVYPRLGLMTRDLLLFGSYGIVFVGRPL